MSDFLGDFLQWAGLLVSSATCFIAASLSFYVFMEQRRVSEDSKKLVIGLGNLETARKEARSRDEFHRWVIMQSISLQEDTIFLLESLTHNNALSEETCKRVDRTREKITRKLYELQIFSGDDRSIKNATRQLMTVFSDVRTLDVIILACRAHNDLPIAEWLNCQAAKMRRRLFPHPVIDPRGWTG